MQGYLSRDGIPPSELLAVGRAEVASYDVELLHGSVVRIEAGFVVHLDDGEALRSRRLLVTTGPRDEVPDIEGVSELVGPGPVALPVLPWLGGGRQPEAWHVSGPGLPSAPVRRPAISGGAATRPK